MCGICVYYGKNNDASQKAFEGLKKLEYRGYDSWGIALQVKKLVSSEVEREKLKIKNGKQKANNELELVKGVGKISEVKTKLPLSKIALGHTRWATHGAVNKTNAHPHLSASGRLVIIHNGVFENYEEWKKKLIKQGFKFKTETDTEVIVNLIEQKLNRGGKIEKALREVAKLVKGRNAFVIFDTREKRLFGVRQGSPLLLGVTQEGTYLTSDATPFLPETKKAVFLENGEIVEIWSDKFKCFSIASGKEIKKRISTLDYDLESLNRGKFAHFFIKEIYDQPKVLLESLKENEVKIEKAIRMIQESDQLFLAGAGTAGRVGLIGSFLLAKIAKILGISTIASEFSTYAPLIKKNSLLITISQSGETADTLEAIEQAKKRGAKILSIVNTQGSSITRESDFVLPMNAGIEKAVASTKATSMPIALLTYLAYGLAGKKKEGEKLLRQVSFELNEFLHSDQIEKLEKLAKKIKDRENLYVIGRGMSYPVALEGAVKLQELPYIHAEGIAGAELKHYAITLIEEGVPAVVLVPNDHTQAEILGNAAEIKARGGKIIGIAPQNNSIFDDWIQVADLGEFGSPIINLVPMQLLAYYLTLERGHDPDYCRNLAKSVTVK